MDEGEAVDTRGDYRVRLVPDPDPTSPRDADNFGVMWASHRRYSLGDNPGHSTHRHNVTPAELLSVRNAHREMFPEWWEVQEFADRLRNDGHLTTENVVEHIVNTHGAKVVLPLYLYDHSGLSMTAGQNLVVDPAGAEQRGGRFVGDEQGWDTSYVGFIFDTARTRTLAGLQDASPEKVEEILRGEVTEYASYLEGDVWGYVVERNVWVRVTRQVMSSTSEELDLDVNEHDEWDEVEAIWGFVGHDYAVEAAKEALDTFAPKKEG